MIGVIIQPAKLNRVSITPTDPDNTMSRIAAYTVRFTPTFPIPTGCNIIINFPAYMQIITPTQMGSSGGFQLHYVNYGLEDINEYDILGINYLGSTLNSL
jgi:hypothetical protein